MIEFILKTCLYFITSCALYSAIRNFIAKKYLWFSMFFTAWIMFTSLLVEYKVMI